MAMHVRLSGEGVFRRPLTYREARRLLLVYLEGDGT
jgi:hypothetical protein